MSLPRCLLLTQDCVGRNSTARPPPGQARRRGTGTGMRIVITGATGNIGTALLRRLLADGEHEVVGLARRPPVGGQRTEDSTADHVRWTSLDLTRDDSRPLLARAFA